MALFGTKEKISFPMGAPCCRSNLVIAGKRKGAKWEGKHTCNKCKTSWKVKADAERYLWQNVDIVYTVRDCGDATVGESCGAKRSVYNRINGPVVLGMDEINGKEARVVCKSCKSPHLVQRI